MHFVSSSDTINIYIYTKSLYKHIEQDLTIKNKASLLQIESIA